MISHWTVTDLFSIGTAVLYLALGLLLQARYRTTEGIILLLASGFAAGPLLMIVGDPAAETLGYSSNMLRLVVNDARLSLYGASLFALIRITGEIVV